MHKNISGKSRKLGNMQILEKEGFVRITLNPNIYPLNAIYSAAYVFMDRAYIILDGNPDKEIIVELHPKRPANLEGFGRQFNNELLNYCVYQSQSEKFAGVQEVLLQRALETNYGTEEAEEAEKEPSYLDDPLGIMKPWSPQKKKR